VFVVDLALLISVGAVSGSAFADAPHLVPGKGHATCLYGCSVAVTGYIQLNTSCIPVEYSVEYPVEYFGCTSVCI
jgi:hypothetical protein